MMCGVGTRIAVIEEDSVFPGGALIVQVAKAHASLGDFVPLS